jgi:hypothetical protein
MKMTSAGPDYRTLQNNAPSAYKAAIERIPAVTTEEPDEE